MEVRVDDSQFVSTWGKHPSGLDNWVFQIGRYLYNFRGTYRLCVSAARLTAIDAGVTVVAVMP